MKTKEEARTAGRITRLLVDMKAEYEENPNTDFQKYVTSGVEDQQKSSFAKMLSDMDRIQIQENRMESDVQSSLYMQIFEDNPDDKHHVLVEAAKTDVGWRIKDIQLNY